eukprot:3587377-Alexandrium_andersonii.AAC.1
MSASHRYQSLRVAAAVFGSSVPPTPPLCLGRGVARSCGDAGARRLGPAGLRQGEQLLASSPFERRGARGGDV